MPKQTSISQDIQKIYHVLFERFGPQEWWPGETAFEVIVGAVLTQNTNWGNVEKAINSLKREDLLSIEKIHSVSPERLAQVIKPAGYFNVKAKRLKNVVTFIVNRYNSSLQNMRKQTLDQLREQWLSVNGIGPETADSILLYALEKPVFVVDAYTKRFLVRHNMAAAGDTYDQIQKIFLDSLDLNLQIFNEYHALIVKLAKIHCKTKPDCETCPLKKIRYDLNNRCDRCYRSLNIGERLFATDKSSKRRFCSNCQIVN